MRLLSSGAPCAGEKIAKIRRLGMNQTDQIYLKTPETRGKMLPEQTGSSAGAAVRDCGFNDSSGVQSPVMARIPDLDAPTASLTHKSPSKLPATRAAGASGRLLSAGLSLKLLVGLGVVLFLIAMATQLMDKTRGKTGDDSYQAWQAPPPDPTADLAPAWRPETKQAQPSATTAPSFAETSGLLMTDNRSVPGERNNINALPKMVNIDSPRDDSAQSSPWPRKVEASADSSPWPNPAHPVLVQSDPNHNGKFDNRRNEPYTADRRNNVLPGVPVRMPQATGTNASAASRPDSTSEQCPVQLEGVIETPSDRNPYEFSRPGLH